jgi:hypothetical protein
MAFRLKMKVYESNGQTYVVSLGVMVPLEERMACYVMNDDFTTMVTLTVDEYNALPYRWFEDRGPAPKASAIPPTQVKKETPH